MSDNEHNQLIVTVLTGQTFCAVEAARTDNVEYNGVMHVHTDSYKGKNKVGKDQADRVSILML